MRRTEGRRLEAAEQGCRPHLGTAKPGTFLGRVLPGVTRPVPPAPPQALQWTPRDPPGGMPCSLSLEQGLGDLHLLWGL